MRLNVLRPFLDHLQTLEESMPDPGEMFWLRRRLDDCCACSLKSYLGGGGVLVVSNFLF